MVYPLIATFALTVAYCFTQNEDANATVRSYPSGGAEGNELITRFYKTNKPTLSQLRAFNLGFFALCFLPLFIGYVLTGNGALGGFSLAVPLGFTISSLLGVREWKKWEKS